MSDNLPTSGGDLFIVDNSDKDWKVCQYLREWAEIARSFDIATGYFEIGSLLALDGQWQKLDHIRILMGDEVTRRTRDTLVNGLNSVIAKLDDSIENEKEKNDFLNGVPAIVEALRQKRIECRVYNKAKFHAKAYITHGKLAVVGSTALVGSSNFTLPGLKDNVELNIQIRREVDLLQQWYEQHWLEAEEVTDEIFRVVERHTRDYPPFDVYAKALQELFRVQELTAGEWEKTQSKMYPVLDQYQKEGYQSLLRIADQYSGAFLCDGVGLGKTFVGLMLIERLVMFERRNVVLLVPKAGRKPVWERAIQRYLPHISKGDFSRLAIYNHTDLGRKGDVGARIRELRETADAIIIDEAHHFRNPGTKGEGEKDPSRYWKLHDVAENKKLFMLTATPVNNRLIDLQHLIELFSRHQTDYFRGAPLGIHSLAGHFRKMENDLDALLKSQGQGSADVETDEVEAEQVLVNDSLFKALVVQLSRAYVKASQQQIGENEVLFPDREPPRVAGYSLKKTYGRLLEMVEAAFAKDKPLFTLAIYYPLAYYKGPDTSIDPLQEGRQKQVVALIRIQFLKRLESSAKAFESSCEMLLLKLLAWSKKHSQSDSEKKRLARWLDQNAELVGFVQQHQLALDEDDEEENSDLITDEMLEAVEELNREEHDISEMLSETFLDLDQIAKFLDELKKFEAKHDDKLKTLIKLLKSDKALADQKVLLFSEYMTTARYLKTQLTAAGIDGVDQTDSGDKRDRATVICQFSPYYNESSSGELASKNLKETRVLISTDVLSEGLNLQDAGRLINYDIHWNPVRLMQRIGRVDRRTNPQIENRIAADHPELAKSRGTVIYWNFLPPNELENILKLYGKVSHKTLKISKTFGIEGKKLLRPDDDYDALRDFTHQYEGATSPLEAMRLAYNELVLQNPGMEQRLNLLPGRVFSGKAQPAPESQAVFFCYGLPGQTPDGEWTPIAGKPAWYLFDLVTEVISEELRPIFETIRCEPATDRQCRIAKPTLAEIRQKVERHIKNTYLKSVQAPVGVRPLLIAWMELS